jgi:HD superfamily phosphodiesterase
MHDARHVDRRCLCLIGASAFLALLNPMVVGGAATGGGDSPPLPQEIAGIKMPRTDAAQAAAHFAHDAMPAFLFNHSVRVFLWAALYAARERLSFDRELLLVASLLHDVGLLPEHESADKPFEEAGAHFAKRFALQHGFGEDRAEIVYQAISLHTGNVPDDALPIVALVEVGAAIDVFGGTQQRKISEEDVAAVMAAFPRVRFKIEFRKLLAAHARRVPEHATWTQDFVCAPLCGPLAEAVANSPWPE